MDETEQYKQRLQAIAEKRRLQEEEDKVRREREDERIRQQQLKGHVERTVSTQLKEQAREQSQACSELQKKTEMRKSLRDQWLMDGTTLSPTALNDACSPPWESQTENMESLSETQHLSEDLEKLETQMGNGPMKIMTLTVAETELIQDVLQNGNSNATISETSDGKATAYQSSASVLTNGRGDSDVNGCCSTAEMSESDRNGAIEGVESTKMGDKEAELGQGPNVNINEEEEEEEEGTLVTRAECVFITDDDEDGPEVLTSQEDQQESMQAEEAPLTAEKEAGETVEEAGEMETVLDMLAESERSEAAELTADSQPTTEDDGGMKSNSTADEDPDKMLEEAASLHLQSQQSQAHALEETTVSLVPIYTEASPSTTSPEKAPEPGAETGAEPGVELRAEPGVEPGVELRAEPGVELGAEPGVELGAEPGVELGAETGAEPGVELRAESGAETEASVASKSPNPASVSGQFQDVPLSDPQESQKTESGPQEQEPLLSKVSSAESAGASSPAGAETEMVTRATRGPETEAPKHKTCQCCSVM